MPDDIGDRDLLVASLREAGAIARKYFGGHYRSWHKGGGNPVTEADIEIDEFLKAHLLAARPGYGWLSEETADDRSRLERERTFVVDPIDGTHGFLKSRPHFTIVAAVVKQGRPVSAAIYNPISDEMFSAAAGFGSQVNDTPISVSSRVDIEGSRILASRKLMEAPQWPQLTVETRASIAYRMALVAKGEFDAMISLSQKSDWDLAAGDLIVLEAGGRVSSQDGAMLIYNRERPEQRGVVCAGPIMHGQLLDRLSEIPPGVE